MERTAIFNPSGWAGTRRELPDLMKITGTSEARSCQEPSAPSPFSSQQSPAPSLPWAQPWHLPFAALPEGKTHSSTSILPGLFSFHDHITPLLCVNRALVWGLPPSFFNSSQTVGVLLLPQQIVETLKTKPSPYLQRTAARPHFLPPHPCWATGGPLLSCSQQRPAEETRRPLPGNQEYMKERIMLPAELSADFIPAAPVPSYILSGIYFNPATRKEFGTKFEAKWRRCAFFSAVSLMLVSEGPLVPTLITVTHAQKMRQ